MTSLPGYGQGQGQGQVSSSYFRRGFLKVVLKAQEERRIET
jgi:hypothetical protein